MNIKIKKLHPDAIVPQYQTAGAACFDFHAIIDSRATSIPAFPRRSTQAWHSRFQKATSC